MKKILLYVFLLAQTGLYAQNYILNSSFESYKDLEGIPCCGSTSGDFVKDWLFSNNMVGYYSDKIKYSPDVVRGTKIAKTVGAHTGSGMLWIYYHPNSISKHKIGVGAYPTTKLTKPLEKGKKYKLEFWIYEQSSVLSSLYPNLHNRVGCLLTKERHYVTTPNHFFYADQLVLDSLPLNRWYKFSKTFTPSCEVAYLTLGYSHTQNSMLGFNKDDGTNSGLSYFIDDISLTLVSDDSLPNNTIVYDEPCLNKHIKPDLAVKETIEEFTTHSFFYASNVASLQPNQLHELDSLANVIKKQSPSSVYEISGHTDKIGKENETLSLNRALSVFKYLMQKHKIHPKKLQLAYHADKKPLDASNLSKNRRTQIAQLDSDVPNNLYKTAVGLMKEGRPDSALIYLKWYLVEEKAYPLILLFDEELAPLSKHPKWKVFTNTITNSYKKYKKGDYALALEKLLIQDRWYRAMNFEDYKGSEHRIYSKNYDTLMSMQSKIDSVNLIELKRLFEKYGHPKMSEVGKEAASAAFYIIQHSNIEEMKKWLPTLEQHCKQKEASWDWYVTMFDRIMMREKGFQRFGTQFHVDKLTKIYQMSPLENKEKVNEFRAKLGLKPVDPDFSYTISVK